MAIRAMRTRTIGKRFDMHREESIGLVEFFVCTGKQQRVMDKKRNRDVVRVEVGPWSNVAFYNLDLNQSLHYVWFI